MIKWNNFCPISFILKFKGDQSQQIPPYTYLFVSPVGISGSRGDKIMISAASLVLSNPTVQCTVTKEGR